MTASGGQATMETLFVMFLMFMLIAGIYQTFLIHNTLFQMTANAYYDAFKNARDKNNSDNEIAQYSSPLTLAKASGGGGGGGGGGGSSQQSFPIIPFFQGSMLGVPTQVARVYWIAAGTKGLPWDIVGTSPDVSLGNQQAPPQKGCGATMTDGDGNSHTVGEMQQQWINDHPHQEPAFPHTSGTDEHGLPVYGLTPNCGN
ncbi:MAG: hypothetical protein LAO31_14535 [Acidobacteriia bacterium]|nr:hypothetical protein [Terriglobia bacterium]